MKVKLYKEVNGELRLVDFGVANKVDIYKKMGYVVRLAPKDDTQPLWAVAKREFDLLWNKLPAHIQIKLADIPVDDELTIDQKLALLKAELVTIYRKEAKKVTVIGQQKVIVDISRRPGKVSIIYNSIKERVADAINRTFFVGEWVFSC